MAKHVFAPTRFHNAIGTAEPVLAVADGDTIVASTLDAAGFDGQGVQCAKRPNPMTGPFFVESAEPGDALEVRIDRMTPNRDEGWTYTPVAANVVEPAVVAKLPPRERVVWRLDRANGHARLAEPPPALTGWMAPFAPMIGCFGVAPALGQAISTATSGPNGGNMDYRRFGGYDGLVSGCRPRRAVLSRRRPLLPGRRRDRWHRHRNLVRDRIHG